MLRSGPARSLSRSTLRLVSSSGSRTTTRFACQDAQAKSTAHFVSSRQPRRLSLTVHKPFGTALQRYATTTSGDPYDHIDKKHEADVAKSELVPHPEEVSTTSSVHQIFHEKGVEETEKDDDMLAGVWQDLVRSPERPSIAKSTRGLIVSCLANNQGNVRTS